MSFIFAEKAKEGLKKLLGAGKYLALFKDLEIMFGVAKYTMATSGIAIKREAQTASSRGWTAELSA